MRRRPTRRYEITSHENISHQDLDNLGYDWTLAADPGVAPRRPKVVYFPESTEEVSGILAALRARGEKFRIRARGHSSNDLVLGDRDTSVIVTEYMDRIDAPDPVHETVRVQCGAVTARIDAALGEHGFGLPVIGDHNHITAGGFASVGGVSPSSHFCGMFVDNVLELEFVTFDGHVGRCTPADPVFDRLVCGTGRFGLITELTLRVIRIDKQKQLLRNDRRITTDFERFLDLSEDMICNPRGARMERGLWADLPFGPFGIRVGQVSEYFDTDRRLWKALADRIAHGYLHGIGWLAGRMPKLLDRVLQYLGMIGIVFSPRYASVRNVESFADRTIDSSVGDPTRMLIVFAPADRYRTVARALEEICRRYRGCSRAVTFITMYVKGIQSSYLARASGDPARPFSEMVLYLGVTPAAMRTWLDAMVEEIDRLCAANGAFRYMHTRTSPPGSPLRDEVDANERLARRTP